MADEPRSVAIEVPSVSLGVAFGEITAEVIENAVKELASLPAEQARGLLEAVGLPTPPPQQIFASATSASKSDAYATATVTRSVASTLGGVVIAAPAIPASMPNLLAVWAVLGAAGLVVLEGAGRAAGADLYAFVKAKVVASLASAHLVAAEPVRPSAHDVPPPPAVEQHVEPEKPVAPPRAEWPKQTKL